MKYVLMFFLYFIKNSWNFCHKTYIILLFLVVKKLIDNYEMTNAFNIIDHLLTIINRTAKQT